MKIFQFLCLISSNIDNILLNARNLKKKQIQESNHLLKRVKKYWNVIEISCNVMFNNSNNHKNNQIGK